MIYMDLPFLVRHLQPTQNGLTIEIYAYRIDYQIKVYENIKADIFDHILPAISRFELCIFQNHSKKTLKDLSNKRKEYFFVLIFKFFLQKKR